MLTTNTMNQNESFPIDRKYILSVLMLFICLFTAFFGYLIFKDRKEIFDKAFHNPDEYFNSSVSGNITRKFFPPMVRVHSLDPAQEYWHDGPYWQHIPPLFMYIEAGVFVLTNSVSIVAIRLTSAFMALLTGIICIASVYLYRKTLLSALAAFTAASLWAASPFTRNLIDGRNFGHSDVLLALLAMCCFAALLWYLNEPSSVRKTYPLWKVLLVSFIISLPIVAKSLLGAIPAATFFIILYKDRGILSKTYVWSIVVFLIPNIAFYGALYLSAPTVFKNEVWVPLSHFKNFEGWARPWYTFLANYIPDLYSTFLTGYFYLLILAAWHLLLSKTFSGKDKTLMLLTTGWFTWNLVVVSYIKSKSPNFIFQMYFMGIFAAVYLSLYYLHNFLKKYAISFQKVHSYMYIYGMRIASVVALSTAVVWAYGITHISQAQVMSDRGLAMDRRFYNLTLSLQSKIALDKNDLVVLSTGGTDCWMKYYPLFLTGAETRNYDQFYAFKNSPTLNMYDRVIFVSTVKRYFPTEFKSNLIYKDKYYWIFSFFPNDINDVLIKKLETNHIVQQTTYNCTTIVTE